MADPTCFGATGTEVFRNAEWEERKAALDQALQQLSVSFSSEDFTIDAADCVNLKTLEDKATDPSYLDKITDDSLDRPTIHLTAIFWNSDIPGIISTPVTTEHWASPKRLKDRGRKISSLNYFSISNATFGKISLWKSIRNVLNPSDVLSGTPIDQVDPTQGGQDSRRQIAIDDANKVAAWLLEKSGAL